jgi:hypothetical protein
MPKCPKIQAAIDASLRNPFEGKPHGWIQWKGTDVCLDVYCACGHHGHVDAEFAYTIRCPECGQVYETNGHIELVPIDRDAVFEDWHEPIDAL